MDKPMTETTDAPLRSEAPRAPASRPAPAPFAPDRQGRPDVATTSHALDPLAALHAHRMRIDALNARLVDLLNERTAVCMEVAACKRAAGVPLHAPAREAEVLLQVRRAARGALSPQGAERIFRAIIAETLATEERLTGGAGGRE